VLSHFSKNIPFMVMIISNALLLEMRRGFIITPPGGEKKCKHGVETPHGPATEKFKMGKCAGKLMAMVFWDCKGVLLVDFMEKGPTINAASYCATFHPRTVISSH
jgi:hypothetical protein